MMPTNEEGVVTMIVEYTIECLPEDVPIRGNAMASGDAEYDTQVEDAIIERINAGNEWAWCCVRVTAQTTIDGHYFAGDSHLGCCNYHNEDAFKVGGYFEDMKEQALADLMVSLKTSVIRGDIARKALEGVDL